MHVPPALASELALLSQAVDDPAVDLGARLQTLAESAGSSVSSYVGLVVSLRGPPTAGEPRGERLQLALPDPGADVEDSTVCSTLLIPLTPGDGRAPEWSVEIVLFAARAGAFVDLAADLAYLLGTQLGNVRLDEHLSGVLPGALSGPGDGATLARRSVVDEAVGVLIGAGLTPEQALAEIDRRALAGSRGRWEVAVDVLRDLTPTDDPSPDVEPTPPEG